MSEPVTQLEQLPTEELIGLIYREPDYWTADSLAVELAKRLSEASKDSKAMDELAKRAWIANETVWIGCRTDDDDCTSFNCKSNPNLTAQIAKRKK